MRINQYLARCGVSSRRKAEDLILDGQILLNEKKITNLATEVNPKNDIVKFKGQVLKLPQKIYLALNKPAGFTTTRSDPYALHTIFELLPKDRSLFPVGRLDRDTAGLILITNDGDFAQKIIHPSKKVEKEYIVSTQKPVTSDQVEKLQKGIMLEDGNAKAKRVNKISAKELEIVIEMGRNRVVRRMITAVGGKVTGLKRTRIGNIMLDLESGKYRDLTKKEVDFYA